MKEKKKWSFIALVMVFAVLATISSLKDLKKDTLIDVNATPITNKVVIIDAGHGLPDEGAKGYFGTTEQYINLQITLKLQQLIEQSGAKVLLTRSDENGIYSTDSNSIRNKKVSDIINRVKLGNEGGADIFISLHLNKFPPSEIYRGWQTFYQGNKENSYLLANCIQENINKNIDFENNRVPHSLKDVYIIEHVKIPTVIIECGFLSNREETELLKTEQYQNKLAWGIFAGIQHYFEQQRAVSIY